MAVGLERRLGGQAASRSWTRYAPVSSRTPDKGMQPCSRLDFGASGVQSWEAVHAAALSPSICVN